MLGSLVGRCTDVSFTRREALEERLRAQVDSTSQKLERMREQEEQFRANVREDIVMLGKLIREEKLERINEDERIVSALDEFTRYVRGWRTGCRVVPETCALFSHRAMQGSIRGSGLQ
eukprot:scaffold4164_cov431-Prasinococcus_capsulatus_cf.AAC.2